jgi:tetratricopeptide (TPR) repeat protein
MTPAQLEECRGIQRHFNPPRSLAQIIVARRYATADELRELVKNEVSRRSRFGSGEVEPASALERDDAELASKLIARGILDEARVRECLGLTRKAREQKPDVRFAQIVLKKGYVTRDALKGVLEVLPPSGGRYGVPPTQVRPAFDSSSLGMSSGYRLPTPPTARPRSHDASSAGMPPLFGTPSGPEPLFGEASGVVRPMFGASDPSSSARAVPPRTGSSRFGSPSASSSSSASKPVTRITSSNKVITFTKPEQAPAPELPDPWAKPPALADQWPLKDEKGNYKTVELSPQASGMPAVQPLDQPPGIPIGAPLGQPIGQGLGDAWPLKDAKGNYKTVELDPRDPGVPKVVEDVGGDPFGEGRMSSKEFDAFESQRVARRDANPTGFVPLEDPALFDSTPPVARAPLSNDPFGAADEPPIGLGKGSSGLADLTEPVAAADGGALWDAPQAPPSDMGSAPGFVAPPTSDGTPGFALGPFDGPTKHGDGGPLGGLSEPGLAPDEIGLPKAAPLLGVAPADQGIAFPGALDSGAPFAGGGASDEALEREPTAPESLDEGPVRDDLAGAALEDVEEPPHAETRPETKRKKRRPGAATRQDPTQTESAGERPRGGSRIFVVILVLLVLGGGGFGAYWFVTQRMAIQEAERAFVDANRLPPKQRDPRDVLRKGEALPEASRAKPDIREALTAVKAEVALLDAKDKAKKIVASINDEMQPQARLDAAESALKEDSQCARAYLERARARIALGRQKGSKALAVARASAATEDLPIAQGIDPKLVEAYWELANIQELTPSGRENMRGQLERIQEADKDGTMGFLAAGRLRALEHDAKAVSEAIALFDRAVTAKPDAPLPYLVRCRFKLSTNRKEDCINDADQAVQLTQQKSAEALTLRAWARRVCSTDLKGARKDLDAALAVDPTWAAALGQRALVRFEEGDPKKAEDDVKAALQIDEGEPFALCALAELLAQPKANSLNFVTDSKKLSDARKALRAAMERDDRFIQAILLHARLALKDLDYDMALREFNRILELDPRNPYALGNRGEIYIRQKNFTEARKDLDSAIEVDPKYERALFIRGKLGIEGEPHNFESAINDLTKAVSLSSDFAEAYMCRGEAYYEAGRFSEAIQDETLALQKGDALFKQQKQHEVYYLRGMAYFNHKEYREAIKDLSQAESLAPPGAPLLSFAKRYLAEAKTKLEEQEKGGQPTPPPDKGPEKAPGDKGADQPPPEKKP